MTKRNEHEEGIAPRATGCGFSKFCRAVSLNSGTRRLRTVRRISRAGWALLRAEVTGAVRAAAQREMRASLEQAIEDRG